MAQGWYKDDATDGDDQDEEDSLPSKQKKFLKILLFFWIVHDYVHLGMLGMEVRDKKIHWGLVIGPNCCLV